jgi:hypothetical protein
MEVRSKKEEVRSADARHPPRGFCILPMLGKNGLNLPNIGKMLWGV